MEADGGDGGDADPVPPGLHSALATDEWFGSVPLALQAALLAQARVVALDSGRRLFASGGGAEGLCCVLAGALRFTATAADGTATMLAYLEPYQWFGEISFIDGLPLSHDAVADGATRVLVVPRESLLAWLETQPAHWRELARLACRKLRTALDALDDLSRLPLEQRLQRRLWLLATGYGSRTTPRRRIRLAQEVLAQMMGVSRQSVNRALKALEARGLLQLRYGEIHIVDLAGVEQAATCGQELAPGVAGARPA